MKINNIWIFSNKNTILGAFYQKELAEIFIKKYSLSGTLTAYPINEPIYEWSIENEFFAPKNIDEKKAKFIESFTTDKIPTFNYKEGILSRE
ncbi:hypothetical protein [uncultured Campylobacter sp.]|uniref:DUF7710 domain-containing protein n=1 Tax=uncultured Campylobacter sp. TaxID=218934 RepID=UPI00262B904D|nr:hypothetical protein [uncultured Campylobacter sp.]